MSFLPEYAPVTSGQYLCAPNQYAPASQTPLPVSSTSLEAWSTGVVCTNSFTAPPSGSVLVTAYFLLQGSASGIDVELALAAVGTTTPLYGKQITVQSASTTTLNTQAIPFYVTGLTPGDSYQFDLLGAAASGDTATIYAASAPNTTTKGGPVILTVQAV